MVLGNTYLIFGTLLCIKESLHFSNGFAQLRLGATILVETHSQATLIVI